MSRSHRHTSLADGVFAGGLGVRLAIAAAVSLVVAALTLWGLS